MYSRNVILDCVTVHRMWFKIRKEFNQLITIMPCLALEGGPAGRFPSGGSVPGMLLLTTVVFFVESGSVRGGQGSRMAVLAALVRACPRGTRGAQPHTCR